MFATSLIRTASVALALVVLGPISSLRAEEPKGDLKTLQGEWVSKDDTGESTWTFKDDKLTLKTPTRAYDIVIKLDSDAKPIKTIDMNVTETSPNSKGFKGRGIYKFNDDNKSATICFGADEKRPTEFKADFQTSFAFELKKK